MSVHVIMDFERRSRKTDPGTAHAHHRRHTHSRRHGHRRARRGPARTTRAVRLPNHQAATPPPRRYLRAPAQPVAVPQRPRRQARHPPEPSPPGYTASASKPAPCDKPPSSNSPPKSHQQCSPESSASTPPQQSNGPNSPEAAGPATPPAPPPNRTRRSGVQPRRWMSQRYRVAVTTAFEVRMLREPNGPGSRAGGVAMAFNSSSSPGPLANGQFAASGRPSLCRCEVRARPTRRVT